MATKTAQIVIDIDDKSLVELNDEIKSLEDTMSNLKVGTQDWVRANQKLGDLKTKFSQATTEAKKLQQVVEDVGGAKQARAIAELGRGMVGAFAGVSGAITLMGGNKKNFDEITAKATSFLSIMMGLKEISRAFSAENLNALKNIGSGFKTLVTSVRGASTAMKTALISTGIGALVVGVGLLIANWDKLKNLISGTTAKAIKEAEAEQKSNEAILKQFEARSAADKQILEFAQKQNEYQKDAEKLANQNLEYAQSELDTNYAKIQALKSENLTIDTKLKKRMGLSQIERVDLMRQQDVNKEMIRGLEFEGQRLDIVKKQAYWYVEIANDIEKLTKSTKDYQNDLIRAGAEANSQRKVYLDNLKILQNQVRVLDDQINDSNLITDDLVEQRKTLLAQVDALNSQEKERLRLRDLAIEELKNQKFYEEQLQKITEKYADIKLKLNEEFDQLKANSKYRELDAKYVENQSKLYDDLVKKREALTNFDKKGHIAFHDATDELAKQLSIYDEQAQVIYEQITAHAKVRDFNKHLIIDAAIELNFFKLQKEEQIKKLELDNQSNENRKHELELQKQEVQDNQNLAQSEILIYQQQLKKAEARRNEQKTVEGQLAVDQEIFEINKKIADYNKQVSDSKSTTVDLDGQILNVETDIAANNDEISQDTSEIVEKQKEVTAEVEKQARLSETAKEWVKKYSEEIDASRQVLAQTFELMATLQDNKAKNMQKDIDSAQKQLDDLMQQESDRKDKLLEYEQLLQDASGERYDEILAKIQEEKKANVDAQVQYDLDEKKRLAAVAARNKAERKAAMWRKAAAIIDAIIAGALAVVKALPNVFLAIAVGVLSAAAVLTIAAQKIPDAPAEEPAKALPKMAKGGVKSTTGMALVGEEGPELVALPAGARVYSNPDSMKMLAGGYSGAYAQGGTIPTLGTPGQGLINYEKLTASFLNAVQALPNPVVSVQKITQQQQEVTTTKSLAGMTR